MAQNAAANSLRIDATFFPDGVNSYLSADILKDTEVRWAINASNAGGIWQTRPGFKTIASFCAYEGHPQMMVMFQPTGDVVYLVVAIAGRVYVLRSDENGGFDVPILLPGIQFNENADQIFWAKTVKAANLGTNGIIVDIEPRAVLVMQDSLGRAAYWDGNSGGHLDPQQAYTVDLDGNTIYESGKNQTPIGSVMAWSGNRLWVAVGKKVIASNINDPLTFTECQTLTQVPFFLFEEEITAMSDRGTSGRNESQVFVWSNRNTNTLRSGVTKRTDWATLGDFQKKIFSDVGCVAGKSPYVHQGLLYWYCQDGLVRFDSTDTVNSTQELRPNDQALEFSKLRMGPYKKNICTGAFGPYLLCSVPTAPTIEGRVYNGQTQVMNRAVIDLPGAQAEAWQGIWTGIKPVEWAVGPINGVNKLYALSKDTDGKIRIYEAFQGNRCDNGHPIPWLVVTKNHVPASAFDRNVFKYFQMRLENLIGSLSIRGYWRGTTGNYHKLLDTAVTATPGSIFTPGLSSPMLFETPSENFIPQTRMLTSPSQPGNVSCGSGGVETNKTATADFSFSLLFRFVGRAALKAYRLNLVQDTDPTGGEAKDKENGLKILKEGLAESGNCPVSLPDPANVAFPEQYLFLDSPPYEAILPQKQTFPTLDEELYNVPNTDCS